MPNRILRDWTDSEKVNTLSTNAERFFTRLIMKADDNGCFHGNCKLLRSSLFPLKIDEVSEKDVQKWVSDCKEVGLLITYSEGSKDYIQICDFKQRLRIKTARFPLPSSEEVKKEAVHIPFPSAPVYATTENSTFLESLFNDFPNTTHAENIARILKVEKADLIKSLPEFRKSANLSYPNGVKFAEHFKNWYLKVMKTQTTTAPKKRNQI